MRRVAAGTEYRAVYLSNQTYRAADETWTNAVYLYDGGSRRFDLIYQYAYTLGPNERQNEPLHWWGPLVETFQEHGPPVTPIGFLDGSLHVDGVDYKLDTTNSVLEPVGDGLERIYEVPNSSFLVV